MINKKKSCKVKTVTLILHIFIFLMATIPLSIHAQTDKTKLEDKLKNISLEEAKQEFINSRSEINKVLSSFEGLESLRISGGPIIESDDERTITNFSVHIKDSIQKGFSTTIASYVFKQKRSNKKSRIVRYSNTDYAIHRSFETFYQKFYHTNKPELTYDKVYFFDGTTKSWSSEEDTIKSTKKIDSITTTSTYYYPIINNIITVDASTKHNQVVFIQKQANSYEIYLDTSLNEDLIYVEAINKEGKALWQKSGYSSTITMPNTDYLKALNNYFGTLIKDIDRKKIKTKKQLIIKLSKTLPQEDDYVTDTTPKTLIYNTCKGNVAQVKLYFGNKDNSETVTFTMANTSNYENNLSVENFYDDQAEAYKYGVMNVKGEWIVHPISKQIYNVLGNYYQVSGNSYGEDKLYYLNLKTKQLEVQDFYMAFTKIYNDDYATITKASDTNEIQGLINYKTQEVLLDAKYDDLQVNEAFYWAREKRDSPYQIYRFSDHKKIMEGNFYDIDIYDDYFIVETKEQTKLKNHRHYNMYDIYDINGKKTNPKPILDMLDVALFGKDNLLPVRDISGDKYYIQKHVGRATINVNNYQKIGSFSYGLAAVKHKENNLYGYINTKGRLVIPCMYRDASLFMGGTALVESKRGKEILINQNNETVFTFPHPVYTQTEGLDRDYGEYTIRDGNGITTTYNHKGKIVSNN